MTSVSYTHLDVYKRQEPREPADLRKLHERWPDYSRSMGARQKETERVSCEVA